MLKYSFTILLFTFTTSLSAQFDCHVDYKFEDRPLNEVFDRWNKWCKVDIIYDVTEASSLKITGDHDMLPLKKALDFALMDTNLAWKKRDDKTIEVLKKIDAIEFIKITSEYKNTDLETVINIWKWNYKLDIEYNKEDIKGIKIFGKLTDEPMNIAFEKILAATPLEFRIEGDKKVVLYLPEEKKIDLKNIGKVSYDLTVAGVIKDEETGETLPFANVMIKGSEQGTTSNLDGHFTIQNVPSDTATLILSYIGYLGKEFRLLPNYDIEHLELFLNSGSNQMDEITVTAQKKEQIMKQSGISKIGMTTEIASILPSTGEKDIFRSLQLLPGVSGTNESSSGLYVRGGTPDQNLILLDGFTVYHVDHLYGFFSAFNSNAIKDVQLYKGGFESKFGGRLSSVVDITAKDGNSQQFNAGVNLSFLSMNGFVESPFANGKGSFIVTARRSYQSFLYNSLFDSFTGTTEETAEPTPQRGRGGFGQTEVQPTSYFYDLNAKVTYRMSQKDKLTFSFYNGEDDLDNSRIFDSSDAGGPFGGNTNFNFQSDNVDVSNWGNVGTSLKWSRKWSNKFFTNTVASYSNYFSQREQSDITTITREDTTFVRSAGTYEDNDLKDLSLKIDNEYEITSNNKLEFGLQLTNNDIAYSYIQNDTMSLIDRANKATISSFYLQDRITLFDRLILNGGLRATNYSITGKNYLEPRASFTYLLNEKLKFKGAYGQYNQFATRVVREDIQEGSRDFWILADDEFIPTANSTHYILGASYDISNYLFDVELFYKDYGGLSEYTTRFTSSGFGPNQTLNLDEQFFTGTGVAKGAEFLVQKKAGNFTGWLGYTWSEVLYNFPAFGESSFYANQDTRNEFKAVASYRTKKFDLSATFVYGTGRPYTAPVGFYEVELLDGNVEPYFQVSEKNALRYPDYHRMDVSANYNFNLGETKAKIGLSVFNVYNRNNTWYKEYDVIEGELLETDISLLGITPSLYFNWSLH